MAKWTKRNNPHVWKRAKRKRTRSKPMAKRRRRRSSSPRRRRGRSRGGIGGGVTKNDLWIAGAAAAGWGLLQHRAEQSKADEMKWFKEDMPIATPIGRTGTVAAALLIAAHFGIARKYTRPAGYGIAAVALAQLGRRNFKFYDEAEAKGIMSGDDAQYLEGDVDLEGEDEREEAEEAALAS
jgi:hypothetical protein